MKVDILKFVITTCLGAVLASVFAYIKTLKTRVKDGIKQEKKDDETIKEAVKILLRADLKSQLKFYIAKGQITTDEYDELHEALTVYEHLDGDGTVHKLWECLQEQVEII